MNNQTPRRTNHQLSSSGKSNSQRESLNSQRDNSNLRCENALVEAKFVNYDHFNRLHNEATADIRKLQEKQDELNATIKSIILSSGAYNLQAQTLILFLNFF
ncbi:unnamed protein product [Meloidogyne enterolobii]|uniref:Uncharacterized protein n=1 Tax=Meloidogyne enterolobii TaxID=390850 RepID=A0ACB1A1X3_MELEN